jgi:CHAD domain-containing protein
MVSPTPSSLIATQLGELATKFPGVRTADVETVHDARVLTRRLRELFRVAPHGNGDVVSQAADRLRTAGRALGEVRELDVLDSLLGDLEPRARFAVTTLGELRHSLRHLQRDARRQMFKTLESLELDQLVADRSLRRAISRLHIRPSHLRRHVGQRSDAVRRDLRRAAGVYMPNRSHQARVAIKKLRYAVEVAAETAAWQPLDLLKDLRRAQSLLGDMHDRQVLIDRLESFSSGNEQRTREAGWLIDLVRADIEEAQRKFLRRLASIESAATECARWATPAQMTWDRRLGRLIRYAAISAVLVPSVQQAIEGVRATVAARRADLRSSA